MSQQNSRLLPKPGKPRLLDQLRHRCRLRHLALSTEQTYVGWIRRFILSHHKPHPLEMGPPEVSAFLTHPAVHGRVAASTQNQALSALLFLYREVLQRDFGWLDDVVRANKPKRLPVVFTPEEAMAIISELVGVRWLMAMQLYGGGLRLMECLRLRVKDLDFERLQVTVRDGKGEKDRVTLLPQTIVEPFKQHLWRVHERLPLPNQLGNMHRGHTPDALVLDLAVIVGKHMTLCLDWPPRNLGVGRIGTPQRHAAPLRR